MKYKNPNRSEREKFNESNKQPKKKIVLSFVFKIQKKVKQMHSHTNTQKEEIKYSTNQYDRTSQLKL